MYSIDTARHWNAAFVVTARAAAVIEGGIADNVDRRNISGQARLIDHRRFEHAC
jgi:hypothetical protein